ATLTTSYILHVLKFLGEEAFNRLLKGLNDARSESRDYVVLPKAATKEWLDLTDRLTSEAERICRQYEKSCKMLKKMWDLLGDVEEKHVDLFQRMQKSLMNHVDELLEELNKSKRPPSPANVIRDSIVVHLREDL